MKAATVAAVNHAGVVARAGGQAAAAAIKDKDLSITTKVTVPITTKVNISSRAMDLITHQTQRVGTTMVAS
jgi:hypothetical protein